MQRRIFNLMVFTEPVGGSSFKPFQKPANFQVVDIPGYGHLCFEVENIDAVLAEPHVKVPTFVTPLKHIHSRAILSLKAYVYGIKAV